MSAAKLHAERYGSGPPLVLVHGFTARAAAWHELACALANRCTVIAVDLPGHGRSPAPAVGDDCGLERAADAAVDAVRAQGVERATWLGYSLGGRVALHVALRHPSHVARLVLESASPGIEDAAERAARAAADDALADDILAHGVAAFVERWMAQPLFRSQARLPAAVLEQQRALRRQASTEGLAAALRALSVGRQASLWPRLGEIAVPTLVVAGSLDDKYGAIARAMAARLPAALALIVPEAGHTVHLEQPAAFRGALEEFLAERDPHGEASSDPGRSRPATQGRWP